MIRPLLALVVCGSGLAALPAQTVTLTANDVLRIHFVLPAPPAPAPDVLQFGLGLVTVNAPYTTRTARLWHGGELLGTAVSPSFGSHTGLLSLGVCNSWREVGSVWAFDNPGDVVDFSSLRLGSIQGILDLELGSGSLTCNLANVTLTLLLATGSGSGMVSGPAPLVQEVVVVPKATGPAPGAVGTVNTWTVTGCAPGSLVVHALGLGCAPILFPATPPVFFDLAPPIVTFAGLADAGGTATLSVFVPPTGSGVQLFTQSAELSWPAFRISNFTAYTFP